MLLAATEPLHWNSSALLAAFSAIAVEGVNLWTSWGREVEGGEFRQVAREHWRRLLGLAVLTGAAGVAVTGLVVLLGVTTPAWLDQPLGWLLLGTAGPAVGAATITKIPVGKAELNVGLSLIYVPARQFLVIPVDDTVFVLSRPKQRAKEGVYRLRVLEAFSAGSLSLGGLVDELRQYASRPNRAPADKAAIDQQLLSVTLNAPPGADPTEWEGEQLLTLTAFIVERRAYAVLDSVVGKPSDSERSAIEAPEPPSEAFDGSASGSAPD
jgi:hypothetical protein